MNEIRNRFARHRLANAAQMALIVAALAVAMAVPAWLMAGRTGVAWALVMVALTVVLAGRVPARMVLVRSGARPLGRTLAPGLYRIVDALYARAGMPAAARLFLVPSAQLNAFAVGTARDGSIAVTEGLLRRLSAPELAGVLAHEVAHLRKGDTRVMSMAAAMTQVTMFAATAVQVLLLIYLPWLLSGAVSMPLYALFAAAVSPTLSTLLQLALSRNREFTADLEAVALTGDPEALALLERANGSWLRTVFGRKPAALPWLRTHPPTEDRIARLRELSAGSMALPRPLPYPGGPIHPDRFGAWPAASRMRWFGRL